MGLDSALAIASSGLSNVQAQLALISHNVANAGTAGYVSETLPQTAVSAGGIGMGVRTGVAQADINTELQSALLTQNATVSSLSTTQTILSPVNTALGSVGTGNDLSGLLTNLQSDFTALANDPASVTNQDQVVSAATSLTSGMNTLSASYTQARQTAQNNLVSDVQTLNTNLATIGTLSDQIVAARQAGQSTADLESQRAAAMQSVSQLVSANFAEQPNGDMLITTTGGVTLPIHGPTDPFSIAAATMTASTPASGTPAITFLGQDVTANFTGGSIGAELQLRDATLPGFQSQLDAFAGALTNGFSAQNLDLFTTASGAAPTTSSGYASTIAVNPSVAATPSLVRDGTTNQNTSGAAGFTGVTLAVLGNTFGTQAAGSLSTLFPQATSLSGLATSIVSGQSSTIGDITTNLTDAQTSQSSLQSTLQQQSGVNIDNQMSAMVALQNAYGANAKIVSAVQSMFTQLLNAF